MTDSLQSLENRQVFLLSLGCAKNLVDSECMSQILREAGFLMVDEPSQADILLVNTCGFIESAKKEAIESILQLADYKQPDGRARYLIVAGCLSQRYAMDILSQMPEVNAVLGTADYNKVREVIDQLDRDMTLPDGQILTLPGPGGSLDHLAIPRQPSTPGNYAYIKVAEGCSNNCSYCAIPGIRGPFVSRPFDEIVSEAARLSAAGYGELILIAQDTTRYGLDLYGQRRLPELIRALCRIPEVRMVRILYVYNDGLTDELIACMASETKVSHYLDLPIQHAADPVLRAMNRRDTQASIRATIYKLRQAMPDLVLRTTVLVGFPGETEADFTTLKEFLAEIQFDRLGCFVFSSEEGTVAARMKPKVKKSVAQARMKEIMALQQGISLQANQKRLGQVLDVTLESISEDGVFYKGRSFAEAPEVDPVIWVAASEADLKLGQTLPVRIVDAGEYELTGVTL
ncbi:MAG: 30S ribosomal protein S12 methylthiotransferase RimO [Eubacteriales bacterium]|nr:30S ribosomal protein S12 methylthiotransferase RimO [Eubacteriales bacterium]